MYYIIEEIWFFINFSSIKKAFTIFYSKDFYNFYTKFIFYGHTQYLAI